MDFKRGTVVKSTGSWYSIQLEDGNLYRGRIIGKFRLNGKKLTNPVAVGDHVEVVFENESDDVLIKKILSRKNYVVRQSPRKKHDLHLLASNVDQAFVIATIREPKLKQGFIDRFLLMTEPHDIPAYIIFNKSDIYSEEDLGLYAYLRDIYEKIGYQVFLCSAITGEGIADIKRILTNKINLIAGQSGVGKSTLINKIEPALDLKTSLLSEYSGKGQHTTTFAEMFDLTFGGKIIDMPGIKTLSFNNLEPMDVAHNFREFFERSPQCKFSDCTHRGEPGCAIKDGIENGEISELRYMNYLAILSEIEDQNYWERHRDM